jgi:thiamine biosynthesis protein ThiS
MQIVLNGQPRELAELHEPATVVALISSLGLKGDRIAVEQNGEIVPRAEWPQAPVHSGDKFEIVHFVGGGSPAPGQSRFNAPSAARAS